MNLASGLFVVLLAGVGAQSPSNQAYQFPADVETILYSPISTGFSCEGQQYGYYADVDNNCQIFHICLPIEDDLGTVVETAHWSFVCGNGTIFDQGTLACNLEENSVPCAEASSLYNTVEFGKIDSDY